MGDEPKERQMMRLIRSGIILIWFVFASACAAAGSTAWPTGVVELTASTPASLELRSILAIPVETPIDFVRWDLRLADKGEGGRRFTLKINYGKGRANTNGFESGGEKRSYEGTYDIAKREKGEVYILTGGKLSGPVTMLRMSGNIFHLLSRDNRLMVGNGGWSYTLNQTGPAAGGTGPMVSQPNNFPNETNAEVVFTGRTPCAEIAGQYNFTLERECPKLKWKLTLYRDPKTNKPAGYSLQRTLERPNVIKGVWELRNGTRDNPQATVLSLDPEKGETSISFLVGDDNVLFFMDKQSRLFTGNSDFSYTPNRQVDQGT